MIILFFGFYEHRIYIRLSGIANDYGQAIATDSTGVYITGRYRSDPLTIYNFDGSPSSLPALINSGFDDVFVVKYNTTGTALWASRIADNFDDIARGIATDSTGVYITGEYRSNPLTIYNEDGTSSLPTLPNSGLYDIFIVKYDTLGTASLADRSSVGTKVISALNNGTIKISVANLVSNGSTATTMSLDAKGEAVKLNWNGTKWVVMANNDAIIS